MRDMEPEIRSYVQPLDHVYKSRCIFCTNGNVQALYVSKNDTFAWFCEANALQNVHNGISYAQIVNKNIHSDVNEVQRVRKVNTKVNTKVKPSRLIHPIDKGAISAPVSRHRGNKNSHPAQDPVEAFVIKTKNRFHIFQNIEEEILDHRSILDPSLNSILKSS